MNISLTFVAASIPRFIRTSCLSHLGLEAIIGSWAIENKNDINLMYDVIMLPKHEFMRARTHLASPFTTSPALRRGNPFTTYIPSDIKEITLDASRENSWRTAALHFIREFGLDINRTIYAGDTSVAATVARRTAYFEPSGRALSQTENSRTYVINSFRRRRSSAGLLRVWPHKDYRDENDLRKLASRS